MDSRQAAQESVDRILKFREELRRLADAGVLLLDDAQRAAVAHHHDAVLADLQSRHDVDRGSDARRVALGLRIVSFLGALAAAAAVYFLYRQYWGLLSTTFQVCALVTISVLALLLTSVLHGRDRGGYFTKLAALVAFACFVLNISLLGAIFSITPSEHALLAFAALALLLGYGCDLRLLLVAGLCCMAGWIAARVGTWGGMYWLYVGQRPEHFFPAAALMLAVPAIWPQRAWAGFAATWRIFGMLCLLLPMLVLANWGGGSYLPFANDLIEGGYQVLGFAASAAACWIGVRRGHGDLVNTGVTFFVIFLYTKFFDWWWDWMPKWVFFLVLALVAVLLMLVFQRVRALLRARSVEA